MFKSISKVLLVAALVFTAIACDSRPPSQESKDSAAVERQQSQYGIGQPIPAFDFSIERDLVIQLLRARNMQAATHSVWRSSLGTIEGDCSSIGFGIPYDTSLTNPLQMKNYGNSSARAAVAIEQAEPNGVFASKNTSATWVLCVGDLPGTLEPHYIESKVTAYPYSVDINYETNRVVKAGRSSITLKINE